MSTRTLIQEARGVIAVSLVGATSLASAFVVLEPQIAMAVEDQIQITQVVTSGIAITSPADVTMSRALDMTSNTAVGNTTWTVTTNNVTGYSLTVAASSTSPCPFNAGGGRNALCNLANQKAFTDLATTSKATWSVSNAYKFGFSAYGADTTGWGSGASCQAAAHTPSATLLYQGFNGTNQIQVASSTTVTGTSGTPTNLCFATEQNNVFAPSGTYQATTTATAIIQ